MNPNTEQKYRKLITLGSQKVAQLQAELTALKQSAHAPIAVIGMGCRFPGGADSPEQFWQLLRQGMDTITEPPPNRWQMIGIDDPKQFPTLYGGFIEQVDQFDAQFFGISPREANNLDPQQRLLLEISWQALEHAGIAPTSLSGSATGVFMGVTSSDYQYLFSQVIERNKQDGVYLITGNSLSAIAGRVAYSLGLTGPAVVTDTSCSSSLVTVHQACQSLRTGACDLALAGGVSLMLRIDSLAQFFAGQVFAPDGRCKAYDDSADSFGRGEGCGVVVLKRLADAEADGDNILAVIQGAMINQDGRTNGMTAPNGTAQQAVIRQALAQSQLAPDRVDYIEGHGTGTSIGDPIELEALDAIFGQREQPLWVGSVKSNMGHLEGAAGVAGLIKAVLALHHAEIPPSLHVRNLNHYFNWAESPIQVATELTPWPQTDHPRVAGVSSFGFSGTNAHVVLSEGGNEVQSVPTKLENSKDEDSGLRDTLPPSIPPARGEVVSSVVETTGGEVAPPPSRGRLGGGRVPHHPEPLSENQPSGHLLPISAKTPDALTALVERYISFLANQPTINLADLCYTVQVGRSHFKHRLAIVTDSVADLQAKLTTYRQDQTPDLQGFRPDRANLVGLSTQGQANNHPQLQTLADRYLQGETINWADHLSPGQRRKLVLPTYPFQRQSYWLKYVGTPAKSETIRPLLDRMLNLPTHQEIIFETAFNLSRTPFLADHQLYDQLVLPGAVYVAMLLNAVDTLWGNSVCRVESLVLPAPLIIPEAESRTAQLILKTDQHAEFQVVSFQPVANPQREGELASPLAGGIEGGRMPRQPETLSHAIGQFTLDVETAPSPVSINDLRQRCPHPVEINPSQRALPEPVEGIDPSQDFGMRSVERSGDDNQSIGHNDKPSLFLGPQFQWLVELWQNAPQTEQPSEVIGKLHVPDSVGSLRGYQLHHGLLDACFQVAGLTYLFEHAEQNKIWLPFAIDTLTLHRPATGNEWYCYTKTVDTSAADTRVWDIQLFDSQGQMVADISGFTVRAISPDSMLGTERWRDWLYTVEWQAKAMFGLRPDYLPTPTQIQTHLTEPSPEPVEGELASSSVRLSAHAEASARDLGEALKVGTPLPVDFPTPATINAYQQALVALEAIALDYIQATFVMAGVDFTTDDRLWSVEQLIHRLGVLPQHHRLFERLLQILSQAEIIRFDQNGWHALSQPDRANHDPAQRITAFQEQYGHVAEPELTLLQRCGEKLGQVLRGLKNPLSLLFPAGLTNDDASDQNQKSPAVQVMNRQVQQAVLTALEHLPLEQGVRILEIGAGTGSSTAWLLPHLPAKQTEYHFTDISPAFLPSAQKKFVDYDFVQYTPLNIEISPLEQGFTPHQFDLIVVGNVLHATRHLPETLAHIRQLLKFGGLLVLLETTMPQRWVDITFGLTDGWWRFADERTSHPLLNVTQWQTLLLQNGFEAVAPLSEIDGEQLTMGQTVFVAQTSSDPQNVMSRYKRDLRVGDASSVTTTTENITPSTTALPQKLPWLIFADQIGVGMALAQELSQHGERSILVQSDEEDGAVGLAETLPPSVPPARGEASPPLEDKAVEGKASFPLGDKTVGGEASP
ncbi:beta-ketoacyl synthase N-terminal-like domain-containing protein, partial [Anaerolineales bacterium HSG6]|nr:beta-ketoacyl synthase N-terminal-like domain-containing protein [Anaerolineales bacterium HSG6]